MVVGAILGLGVGGAAVAQPAWAAITVNCATQTSRLPNSAPSGSTIDVSGFCTNSTVPPLPNFTIPAGKNLAIVGPATLDGQNNGTVLTVQSGATATLNSLTIQNGKAVDGGGIDDLGTTTFNSGTVSANTASGGGFVPSTGGGGIYTNSTLPLNSSTVSKNTTDYPELGAGIFNDTSDIRPMSVVASSTPPTAR